MSTKVTADKIVQFAFRVAVFLFFHTAVSLHVISALTEQNCFLRDSYLPECRLTFVTVNRLMC
jgi:hypothetical protein